MSICSSPAFLFDALLLVSSFPERPGCQRQAHPKDTRGRASSQGQGAVHGLHERKYRRILFPSSSSTSAQGGQVSCRTAQKREERGKRERVRKRGRVRVLSRAVLRVCDFLGVLGRSGSRHEGSLLLISISCLSISSLMFPTHSNTHTHIQHEIRSPLHSIVALSSLLLESDALEADDRYGRGAPSGSDRYTRNHAAHTVVCPLSRDMHIVTCTCVVYSFSFLTSVSSFPYDQSHGQHNQQLVRASACGCERHSRCGWFFE